MPATANDLSAAICALYGWDGTNQSRISVESAAQPNLRMALYQAGTQAIVRTTPTDQAFEAGLVVNAVLAANFDDVAAGSTTENQYGALRMTSTRVLLSSIADPTTPTNRAGVTNGFLNVLNRVEANGAVTIADGYSPSIPAVNTSTGGAYGGQVTAYVSCFNGTAWDRQRNNFEATQFASAVRSATATGADQTNYNGRGVVVTLDITAVPGVDTVQLTIEGKDSLSGKYYQLAVDAAQAGTGTRVWVVYPGAGAAMNGVSGVNGFPLPRVWRVKIVHSAATNFTYSCSAVNVL